MRLDKLSRMILLKFLVEVILVIIKKSKNFIFFLIKSIISFKNQSFKNLT